MGTDLHRIPIVIAGAGLAVLAVLEALLEPELDLSRLGFGARHDDVMPKLPWAQLRCFGLLG